MSKVLMEQCYRPVYPSPAGLITSIDGQGRPNIITLGEVFNLSIRNPVIVGIAIAPARYSHKLIADSGEFVVNLPTVDIANQVITVGSCSGRSTDKFALTGLTPLPAHTVRPPLIAECPVNLECNLLSITTFGDHDLFAGQVVAQHVDRQTLSEDGRILPDRLRAFAFIENEFRALTDLVLER